MLNHNKVTLKQVRLIPLLYITVLQFNAYLQYFIFHLGLVMFTLKTDPHNSVLLHAYK
jgi:hypothetical protein